MSPLCSRITPPLLARAPRAVRALTGLIGLASALVIALGAFDASTAQAQATPNGRRAIALDLAREGRCEVALGELRALQSDPPSDAELQRLIGECAIRLQDFAQAIKALEQARRLDPGAPAIDLHLAIAYYHRGDFDAARGALDRMPAGDARRPEAILYAGLVAYERADYEAAIGQLDAASQLSDRPAGPVAPLFLARSLGRAKRAERAREAYARVIEGWPDTPWAEQAQRELEALDASSGPRIWASLELGFEHDDNVLLRGRGVGRPAEIAGQSDQRGYWFFDVGAMLLEREPWAVGALVRYGGSEHRRLERFDTHAPGATLWIDRELGVADSSLRLQYDFDTAWIDAQEIRDEVFVINHLVTASLFKPWSRGATSLATASLNVDDYRYDRADLVVPDVPPNPADPLAPCAGSICSPAGINEFRETNRDGIGWGLSLEHREGVPIELPGLESPWIEGEYRFHQYIAEGREYDALRHQVELTVGATLPLAIAFRLSGRYAYVSYENFSVFPDPGDVTEGVPYFLSGAPRRDHETGLRVALERAFGDSVVLIARYTRTRNRSPSDVFDYTRDLVGLAVRVGFSI